MVFFIVEDAIMNVIKMMILMKIENLSSHRLLNGSSGGR